MRGRLGQNLQCRAQRVAVTLSPDISPSLSSFIISTSSSSSMAQPQPIIHHPFQDDHPMPSPPYSSFNPASYTRSFFGSPNSWRPGSFGNGNRYFPGTSPGQLLGPLEYVLFIPPHSVPRSHIFLPFFFSLVLPTSVVQARLPHP